MAHIDCNFYSSSLKRNTHVTVYTPSVRVEDCFEDRKAVYTAAETGYPVLYLLHGIGGGCMDWSRFTGIERYAREKRIAVIMPSVENSCCLDLENGEKYLTYVAKELPALAGMVFPLSDQREKTAIAGVSTGGYGAFRCALECPERFGYAASLSGTLDLAAAFDLAKAPDLAVPVRKIPANYRKAMGDLTSPEKNLMGLIKKHLESGVKLPAFYLSCGTEDSVRPMTETFYEELKKCSVTAVCERFSGGPNWDFWDAHIRDVLRWFP